MHENNNYKGSHKTYQVGCRIEDEQHITQLKAMTLHIKIITINLFISNSQSTEETTTSKLMSTESQQRKWYYLERQVMCQM